jgi:hypothetical protein
MTENEPAAADRVSDGLIVRGRPPFAMTPTSLLRNPSVSSHAVRLWSVLASYTYGDRATDRPSRAQLAADVGWKSPRSVDGYLTELQDAGYLTVQRRWRPDGGKARNLYILEWEPHYRSTSDGTADPLHADNSVSAAQTHAQNPAHGGTPDGGAVVDNPVGAGPTHAQDPAHGVTTPRTHAQNPAHTHGQDPAHLGEEPTTKKEQPPTHLAPTTVRSPVPRTTGPTARATDLAAEADALVRVIRDRLPGRLRVQLSTATLRTRAQALASVGWTAQPLAAALTDRVWHGAHGGAVITWLTDLASVGPPHAAANQDSRATTLRLRAEAARAKSAAAGPDSPARNQARQLAAQLRRRRS